MPGHPSQSGLLQYIGAAAALVGITGYVVFGWRFGDSESAIPLAIGVGFAVFAVGWTLYQRL